MARGPAQRQVVTAAELARICQVDLKTIHHWAARDSLPHFRTPGRHLRFYAADVTDFLRRYGYAVPSSLAGQKPHVHLISPVDTVRARWERGLSKRFHVHGDAHPVAALLSIGEQPPDAVVLDLDTTPHAFEVLRQLRDHDRTRHVRVIACSDEDTFSRRARSSGASALISPTSVAALRRTLAAALGVDDH